MSKVKCVDSCHRLASGVAFFTSVHRCLFMAASKTQSVPDGEELKTTSRRNGRLGFVNFGVFRSRVAGCDSTEARKQQKASRNSWQEAAVSLGLNTNPNCFHYTLNSIEANQAADNSFHSDHFRWPLLQRTLGKVGEEGKNYKRERERDPPPLGLVIDRCDLLTA